MSVSPSSIWSSNFFILLFLILFYFIRKSKGYLHINVHFILASFILCICRLAVPVEFSFTKTIFSPKYCHTLLTLSMAPSLIWSPIHFWTGIHLHMGVGKSSKILETHPDLSEVPALEKAFRPL